MKKMIMKMRTKMMMNLKIAIKVSIHLMKIKMKLTDTTIGIVITKLGELRVTNLVELIQMSEEVS